jgi:hypothetical protein
VTQTGNRAFGGRRPPMVAAALLLGLAAVIPPSGVAAQGSHRPIVQVICQVSGGVAKTVRVIYPVPVKNVHIFEPQSGGSNVVIHPAASIQVYLLAVPAGSYRVKYAPQLTSGGYPPLLSPGPVIVIPPFTVAEGRCQRSQAVGTPSS